jgi:TRAP-type mannitol/chloroaromatic compound transport system permease small subunit
VKIVRIAGALLVVFGTIAVMTEQFGYSVLIYYGTQVGGALGIVLIIGGAILVGPEPYMKYANAFSEGTGVAVSWLTTLMVVVVFVNVVLRYVFGKGLLALQDLSWYLFGILFMLGAAYTLQHDRHVRVDIIYINLSPKLKAWINLLGAILFLLPFCVLGILISVDFVETSFRVGETTPDPGGLPARYLIKAMIPLGFLLMLIQGLSLIFKSFLQLQGKLPLPKEG